MIIEKDLRYSLLQSFVFTKPNTLDLVMCRLMTLADEEMERRSGRKHEFRYLSEANQWELILLQAREQLALNEIEPATFDYRLTAKPAIVCLVELVKLLDAAEHLKSERMDGFLEFIERRFRQLDRTVTSWLERRGESHKRSGRANKGAAAKAARQRQIIADAIRQFDPGESSGKSKYSRAEIVRKRAQLAKASGVFPEADRLPKNLRKYL